MSEQDLQAVLRAAVEDFCARFRALAERVLTAERGQGEVAEMLSAVQGFSAELEPYEELYPAGGDAPKS